MHQPYLHQGFHQVCWSNCRNKGVNGMVNRVFCKFARLIALKLRLMISFRNQAGKLSKCSHLVLLKKLRFYRWWAEERLRCQLRRIVIMRWTKRNTAVSRDTEPSKLLNSLIYPQLNGKDQLMITSLHLYSKGSLGEQRLIRNINSKK
jgi:hypothetical protein